MEGLKGKQYIELTEVEDKIWFPLKQENWKR